MALDLLNREKRTMGPTHMPSTMGLRAMVFDSDERRASALERALMAEGHIVVARGPARADICGSVRHHGLAILFVGADRLDADTLSALVRLHQDEPLPVVVFAEHSDAETTRRAVQAGVSAYVVDGFHPARLAALVEVAIARFDLYQTLRTELESARTRLADNRDIEKAKGLLMKRRGLDEAEAYGLLRRMAMGRKQRIGDFARVLLSASDAL